MTGVSYPASAEDVSYGYDSTAGGNLGIGALTSMADESGSTAFSYDNRPGVAKVATTIGGRAYALSYSYDDAGRVTQIAYPDMRLVSYSYDASGYPSAIATAGVFNGRPFVDLATGIALHPFSDTVKALSHANGVDDARTVDQDGRIISETAKLGMTILLSRALSYNDGSGDTINLAAITDTLNAGNNQTFGYTGTNRLEETTGPWGALDFATDGVGNRTTRGRQFDRRGGRSRTFFGIKALTSSV